MTEQIPRKHSGMTNEEFAELGKYIRFVADRLGLRDWFFSLRYEAAEERDNDQGDLNETHPGAGATIDPVYGKKFANVWVCRDFRDIDPERQRVWICHELIHIHLDLIDTLTRNEFRTMMGEMAYNAWRPGFVYGVEHAVNALAEVIGPTVPLINWPDKSKGNTRGKPKAKKTASRSKSRAAK